MQLIKDFSDISRFVSFLTPEYQQKLLTEINSLVIRFMDEQTRVNSLPPSPPPVQQNEVIPIVNPFTTPENPYQSNPGNIRTNNPPPPVETNNNLDNLRNTFSKNSNVPPPPPPSLSVGSPQMGRTIASGAFNLKANFSGTRPQNKKQTISIVEAMGYITPVLTEVGETMFRTPGISTDLYQLLREINGQNNLKEIYLFLNPSSNLWGKFIEKIYPLYRERALNLRKSRNYPSELDLSLKMGEMVIGLGLLDEVQLQRALDYQKNPPQQNTAPSPSQISSMSWIERTKSLVGSTEQTSNQPPVKKKLGDVMVEMKLITRDELENVLTLQKWLKNIIEHS